MTFLPYIDLWSCRIYFMSEAVARNQIPSIGSGVDEGERVCALPAQYRLIAWRQAAGHRARGVGRADQDIAQLRCGDAELGLVAQINTVLHPAGEAVVEGRLAAKGDRFRADGDD